MPKVSFATADMGEGGGLFEGPAVLGNARFGKTDYNGKAEAESTALLFTGQHLDANDELTEDEWIVSTGKGFDPSEDDETPSQEGPYLIAEQEGKKLNKSSAAGRFITSYNEQKGEAFTSAADLNGLVAVLERVPAPTQDRKDRKVYIIKEILDAAPWEAPKKPAAKPAAKVASPKAAEVEEGVSRDTLLSLMSVIVAGADKKGVKVVDIASSAQKAISSWKDAGEKAQLLKSRAALIAELVSEEFLSTDNDVFSCDGSRVVAA